MYKAAVIGCGNIGFKFELDFLRPKPASHVGAYLTNPNTQLVCVVDKDIGKLRGEKMLAGVKAYDNLDSCLFQNELDIVTVATPAATHFRIIKSLLRHGIGVIICEKPLSDNLKDAKKILDLANRTRIFLVNYQRRFVTPYTRAREKIRQQMLGRVLQANVIYTNGIYQNGSHAINTLRFLLDDEADWVIGHENKSIARITNDYTIDGLVHFKSGTLVSFQTLSKEKYATFNIKIYGETGALFINRYGFEFRWIKPHKSSDFWGLRELDVDKSTAKVNKFSMTKGVVEKAVGLMKSNRVDSSMAADSLEDIKIIDSMVRSSFENSKKCKLKY